MTDANRIGRRTLAFALCAALVAALPAAAQDLRPLCPDRPCKGTSACTLDAGHIQIEIDTFDTTTRHSGTNLVRTILAGAPTLKYGLSDRVDVEAGLTPYLQQTIHGHGLTQTLTGHGDLYVRAKWNFLGFGGPFAAVLEPFVKAATASRGLGDGAQEGGIVLPLSYALGNGWSLAATPEADYLRDASGSGRHAAVINVIGLNRIFEDGVNLGGEIWTSQDFDPTGETAQYSFDLDMAWQPPGSANRQLDAGMNFGLNASTPSSQFYLGVSERF